MKTLIMLSEEKPIWGSCVSIRRNLLESYRSLKSTSLEVLTMRTEDKGEAAIQARDIFSIRPGRIVFIDHQPHSLLLLEQLSRVYSEIDSDLRPELVFHVYGDFIYFGEQWILAEKHLMLFPVKFICASEAQMYLVRKSLNKKDICVTSPFPVDENLFFYDEKKRKEARERLGLSDKEKVFLYTGRLSRQKSIIDLNKIFADFMQETGLHVTLLLAGGFDDLGVPYLNFFDGPNRYFTEVLKEGLSLPDNIKNRIRFLGQYDGQELSYVYNAADVFISLSVHNDEDFGMAPAEAGMSGLPLILTDWAGYKAFRFSLLDCCDFVPIALEQNRLAIAYNRTIGLIGKRSAETHDDGKRKVISDSFRSKFSIEAVAKNLEHIHKVSPGYFQGFEAEFKREVMSSVRSGRPLFATNVLVYNDFYRKLYASYF